MQKVIKEIKSSDYKGNTSYSVTFTDDSDGLVTASTIEKELDGKFPSDWKDGATVECDIEEVKSRKGDGVWFSIKPIVSKSLVSSPLPTNTPSSASSYKLTPEERNMEAAKEIVLKAILSSAEIISNQPDKLKVWANLIEQISVDAFETYKKLVK